MSRSDLLRRVARIEETSIGRDDAELEAFGRTVTDDELRTVAADTEPKPQVVLLSWRKARDLSDIALLRIVRPAIETMRAKV